MPRGSKSSYRDVRQVSGLQAIKTSPSQIFRFSGRQPGETVISSVLVTVAGQSQNRTGFPFESISGRCSPRVNSIFIYIWCNVNIVATIYRNQSSSRRCLRFSRRGNIFTRLGHYGIISLRRT